MKTLQTLIGILALSIVFVVRASSDSPEPKSGGLQTKPNILFILSDDQRWDTLGCYGNSDIKTPNLDKFAADGARLDEFYVAGPICCPSRASFLTGLYPHQTGIVSNGGALSKEMPAVAGFLNEAGYLTGFIGKAHVGGEVQKWGFREFPIYLPGGESEQENPILMVNGEKKHVEGNITEIFTNAALAFLDKHKSDRWFLWFATTAPHYPYYQDPANPYKKIGAPPGWPKQQKFESGTKWRDYYSTITMLDGQIGRILQRLNELGLAQNTFVLFVSDNGNMFGSHGFPAKHVWFEESARVPALARWPGHIQRGTHVAAPLSSVDFLPTVFDLAGIEKRLPSNEGVSMMPALTGGVPRREAVFSEVHRDQPSGGGFWQMVRVEQFKYVRFQDRKEEHLYDLNADPHESNDLISSEKYLAKVLELKKHLEDWLADTPVLRKPKQGKE